jgi:hypothetical protein
LELKPWEFWRLTPREFRLMLDGVYRREDRAWHKVGTLGLWLLSPHTKKRLTILGLLNRARLRIWPTDNRPVVEPDEGSLEEMAEAAEARAIAWAKED